MLMYVTTLGVSDRLTRGGGRALPGLRCRRSLLKIAVLPPPLRAGDSTSLTASTSLDISYGAASVAQSGAASTHRLDPSLTALIIIRPPSISHTAWTGRPASKIRAAPAIRLARPE